VTSSAQRFLGAALVGAWLAPLAYLALRAGAADWPADRALPASWTADRWTRLLDDSSGLANATLWSFLIAAVVAVVATGLGFISSKALAESRRSSRWLALAHLPFGFSPVILGACWSYFALRVGVSGTALGIALAHISVGYAFAVVFLWNLWTPRLADLEGVARTLGASPTQTWLLVLWPHARKRVLLCGAQTFFFSWMQYGLTFTVGGGKVRTLPLLVYDFVFEADPGYAAVASLILMLPVFGLMLFDPTLLRRSNPTPQTGPGAT